MQGTRGGGERNEYPARNQADTEGYETQDERPRYDRSRVEDDQDAERADVESAQDTAREQARNKRLDKVRDSR